MSSNTDTNSASLLSGHAQYAKGYVEETIGNVTRNKEWQDSGKNDAKAGIDEMKTASQQNNSTPTQSGLGGKIEEVAGKAVGCDGMAEEGKERQPNV